MGVFVHHGNHCDINDQLPHGSKNTSQIKGDANCHHNGDVKTDVFRRLSMKNTASFDSLKGRSQVEEGNDGVELSKKPRFYNFLSHSSDETASTLSNTMASSGTKSSPKLLGGSQSSFINESVSSTMRSPGKANVLESRTRTRPRSRSSSPFHNRLASQQTKSNMLRHGAIEAKERPKEAEICASRSRDPSPFYEKLASQHTKAFTQRLQNKPPLPSEHFAVDCVPFCNIIHSSNDSLNGSEVSSITQFRFPTPPPSRRRFNKSSSDARRGHRRNQTIPSSSFSSIHERLASTETKASAIKKGLAKDTEQKKKITRPPLRSQDALYYRLAKLDTVASSRRKPSPSRRSGLTPYEMSLKKEEFRNRKPPVKNKSSVYDRLSTTGTMSSLRKQKTETNRRYKSQYETFGESCKTALMRRFEGSTHVKM
mmetsp:Transcript_20974/g.30855  ORF Transcript_20974/g.30855 Transcript_20974/m.30855 type:complete len:426 (+) Transcript_20974:182-1459(+)